MFFVENEHAIELLGVFKLNREEFNHKSFNGRAYDSLSIRIKGSAKFETKKKTVDIKKGDVLYIPQKAEYRQITKGETVIAVHFINYCNFQQTDIESLTIEDTQYIEEIFTKMYNAWKEKKQGHRYHCLSLFYNLLYYINCTLSEKRICSLTHENEMSLVMDYIHRNYRNNHIEISNLSQLCSVSDTYFRRLFKKIHGVSPQQYIINLKLEFAYHLLGSNLYTVSEVSQKSGFSDTKYFSRIFKQHYNCTPKQLQQNGLPLNNA